ncbi:type III secretion system inner membrane ring subunit SctD [Candidatus Thiothrix anitrata]|jgi:type III secretion system YscD/HrpQ family protein|uniref:Type III secretion system inner membrane ring subunit SctD n=1 Tax=Candidatus Thiothrix anitrata TaxID=2823902 RepID=A0ABX7X8C1_9GAMM|nr:type III secretion system inner membrane ring subunit SctD [Candidatus Thiothrix anitrata]QTR51150.1 type III secretion system inner membrane ring subunit SctD [Candidatus Thiothrix anitrata]
MSVQHTAFILKVLSGINEGASVRLKTGSSAIGRSMSCDIILHDEAIADQHVRLLVAESSIILRPLARPVFIESLEVTADEVELKLYQTVRVGSVEFMVVDANDGNAVKYTRVATSTPNERVKIAPAQTGAVVNEKAPVTLSKSRTKVYLLVGLGLLLLGNAIFFYPQFMALLQQSGIVASPETRAAAWLAKLGRDDFTLEAAPDGSISLRGYTRTTLERNALIRQMQDAGIPAKLAIWSQEEMVASATTIARSLDEPAIKVSAGETIGGLKVYGFVSKSTAWERIRGVILADVGGVQSIDDDKLQSMDGYLASFVQFVEKNGLSGRLKITTDGKRVIVKGELTRQEIEKIGSLRKEFIDTYGDEPAIQLDVVDVRTKIKLAIRSASVGKVPFLVAKDGKKYMEGSAIGENYFVKSIRPDHVVLVNKGMEIPFYYGIEEGRK